MVWGWPRWLRRRPRQLLEAIPDNYDFARRLAGKGDCFSPWATGPFLIPLSSSAMTTGWLINAPSLSELYLFHGFVHKFGFAHEKLRLHIKSLARRFRHCAVR